MKSRVPGPVPEGKALNRRSYEAIAPAWDGARSDFCGREREYVDALLEGLPPGSRALDLGCGTGRPIAGYVLSKGHHVTGVDQAGALLEIARGRYPGATWVEGDVESFDTEGRFEAIVCWDVLFHLDRGTYGAVFRRFAALLVAGGRVMLTCGGSEHPPFTDTMFGREFFYDSHPPKKVLRLLEGAGFVPVVSEFMNPPTGGRDKGRYAVVARLG